jgi:methyl-accepting chemotaxis protein
MKRTVGLKIGAVLGSSLAVLATVGVLSYRTTSRLIEDTGRVQHTQRIREAISRFMSDLYEAETLQRGYLLTGVGRYRDTYQAAAKAVAESLAALRVLVADTDNQARRMAALEPLVQQRLERLAEGEKVRAEAGLEGAAKFAESGIGSNIMNQIRTIAGDMIEEENAILEKRTRETAVSSNAATGTIMLGVPAALLTLGLIGIVLARNIRRPLQATAVIAERLARGDVAVDIVGEDRRDEAGLLLQAFKRMAGFQKEMAGVAGRIAEGDLSVKIAPQCGVDLLGNAFSSMVENLRRLTSKITEAANVLASAATEISTSVAQVAASSSETAAAVSETTATVEEVRQTSSMASERAKTVSDNSQQAARVSQAGILASELTAEKMNNIRQQVEAIAESIVRLSEQTQAIGTIIATVDDIAEQSNLLAVNAAIEAAKAGEQGRGFAVVAQEIKNLAAQSKQATGQVRTILGDIQKATGAAVMAAEQGGRAVEAGMSQSKQSGDSIRTMTASVQEAAQTALQIFVSSQQQVAGMTQVVQAMASIKQASIQNVDSINQLKASAVNLQELGGQLRVLVSHYKT